MDAKDAIVSARFYLTDCLSDEEVRDVGLEEVKFDDETDSWRITLGFSRSWDTQKIVTTAFGRDLDLNRTYKMLRINDRTGSLMSIEDRFLRFAEA